MVDKDTEIFKLAKSIQQTRTKANCKLKAYFGAVAAVAFLVALAGEEVAAESGAWRHNRRFGDSLFLISRTGFLAEEGGGDAAPACHNNKHNACYNSFRFDGTILYM